MFVTLRTSWAFEESIMASQAKGTFKVTSWVEEKYGGPQGTARLARVNSTHDFEGDIEGESEVEYVMIYNGEKPVSFAGFERVIGKVGEREGSFVLQVDGTYSGGNPSASWSVVSGSGTGELQYLRGEGTFGPNKNSTIPFTLHYDVRKPREKRAA
jgi:Protein of unknown function (DUF3224)